MRTSRQSQAWIALACGALAALVLALLLRSDDERRSAGSWLADTVGATGAADRALALQVLRDALRETRAGVGRPESETGPRFDGVVLDSDGMPVNGATVSAADWSALGERGRRGAAVAVAHTGEGGRFEVAVRGRGRYLLRAEHPDWVASRVGPLSADPGRDPRPVEIRLRAGARIAGTVTDASGRGVAGSEVRFLSARAVRFGADVPTVLGEQRADDAGAFVSRVLPREPTDVLARAEGSSALIHGVVPGESPLSVVLASRGTVHGTVIDSRSRAVIEGVRVALTELPGFEGATDESGRFALAGVPEGRWTLRVEGSGYLGRSIEIDRPAELAEVELDPTPRLLGTVLLADGEPAAGARLVARPVGAASSHQPLPETTAGPGGEFDWLVPLSGPGIRVRATHPAGGDGWLGPLELEPGKTSAGWRILLNDRKSLVGLVRDEAGRALSYATVRAVQEASLSEGLRGPAARVESTSTQSGSYGIVLPQPGEWTVRFEKTGFFAAVHSVAVSDVEVPLVLDPFLRPGGSLEGTVMDEAGRPVDGAEVVRLETLDVQVSTTDTHGRFRFDGVADDAQSIVGGKEGWAPTLLRDVWPGDGSVEVVLERGASLRGTVLDGANGRPVSSFRVTRSRLNGETDLDRLFALDPQPFRSSDGTFELAPVRRGYYALRIEAPGYAPCEAEAVATEVDGALPVLVQLERGHALRGTVTDARSGLPLEDAEVSVYRRYDESRLFQSREKERTGMSVYRAAAASSDASGRFLLTGLEDGTCDLSVRHPDYVRWSREIDVEPLSRPRGRDIGVSLEPGVSVSGRAFYGDGSPAGNLTVFTSKGSFLASTQTAPDGRFRLRGLVAGQVYTLVANELDDDGRWNVGRQTLRIDGGEQGIVLVIP